MKREHEVAYQYRAEGYLRKAFKPSSKLGPEKDGNQKVLQLQSLGTLAAMSTGCPSPKPLAPRMPTAGLVGVVILLFSLAFVLPLFDLLLAAQRATSHLFHAS